MYSTDNRVSLRPPSNRKWGRTSRGYLETEADQSENDIVDHFESIVTADELFEFTSQANMLITKYIFHTYLTRQFTDCVLRVYSFAVLRYRTFELRTTTSGNGSDDSEEFPNVDSRLLCLKTTKLDMIYEL